MVDVEAINERLVPRVVALPTRRTRQYEAVLEESFETSVAADGTPSFHHPDGRAYAYNVRGLERTNQMNNVIEANGLVKRYGNVTALDGLDLTVPEGTVLELLGPNGAGKTTAISILTTLLEPDSGTTTVAGADVIAAPSEVRKRIGLSGQNAAVDEHLTGFENSGHDWAALSVG